jgi:glycosyltransferase involved in cell wall biosynthesis
MIKTEIVSASGAALKRDKPLHVLYSFPHKLGADRICYTAWQQVNGLANAGANLLVRPGALSRPVPDSVRVKTTLARGPIRIPYKLLGKMRALALHDSIIARSLCALGGSIDLVHTWPAAGLKTINAATQAGMISLTERPNAHTRFAFNVVRQEFDRLGLKLPSTDEYFFRDDLLSKEEEEYQAADYILCPSDFVVKTFVEQGIPKSKLLRHTYGFDDAVHYPDTGPRDPNRPFTALFAGVCAVRKGLHYALEAWLRSPAAATGQFLIAGDFLPSYATRLSKFLAHPSIKVLGHRNDIPNLMRQSDVLVLPSVEEGFGLVIAEAIGSGCVPLASDACTEICEHMVTGLVHHVGDVDAITSQLASLYEDADLLRELRARTIKNRHRFTWRAAGIKLLAAYREAIERKREHAMARTE